jgi:hypothetical protein
MNLHQERARNLQSPEAEQADVARFGLDKESLFWIAWLLCFAGDYSRQKTRGSHGGQTGNHKDTVLGPTWVGRQDAWTKLTAACWLAAPDE